MLGVEGNFVTPMHVFKHTQASSNCIESFSQLKKNEPFLSSVFGLVGSLMRGVFTRETPSRPDKQFNCGYDRSSVDVQNPPDS